MNKKNLKIEQGHTLIEYRYCYGRLYDKGKILSFSKNETKLMNPKYRYWELKDDDGEIKYFQLPSGLFRSDYNISKHKHKKPFIFSMIILAGAMSGALTSYILTRALFSQKNIDEVKDPAYAEIVKKYNDIVKSGKDPYDNMSLDELANISVYKFVYESNKENRYVCVARGNTVTPVPIISPVRVEVRNALIRNGDKALEESDSYSNFVFAPKVGKRDYSDKSKVTTYEGVAASPEDVSFSTTPSANRTTEEFKNLTGKDVYFPFLYTISKETVLTGNVKDEDPVTHEIHNNSKKSRDENGNMTFYLELHNKKSVAKYSKRMTYLSGKVPQYFNYVNLTLKVDKNFHLYETVVNEKYDVGNEFMTLPTTGTLKTRYYNKDVIDIPTPDVKFDYARYSF